MSRVLSPESRARIFWHSLMALGNLAIAAAAICFILGAICGLYDQGIF
jgi:hypothetical protein